MKIVLFTATGAENLGDELITLCEIREFLKEKNIQITLFSHDVERTKRFFISQRCSLENIIILEYFPNALRKQPLKNIGLLWHTFRAIKEAERIYIGWGGLFYGKSEEWHSPLKLWSFRLLLAKMLGKKITYLSLGVTCEKEELHFLSKNLFQTTTITVRDKTSQQIVQDVWYSATILPDPVWTYTAENEVTENKKIIGISLRKWFLSDNLVIEIIKTLQKDWYEIVLLPHSLHPFDEEAHDGYYLQNFLFPGVKTAQSIEQALEYYKNCHIIIAMRLHSMILASIHAKPFIGISYGTKTSSLLSEIGWSLALTAEKTNLENLAAHIRDIESHYSLYENTLREITVKMRTTYLENLPFFLWKSL